MVKYKVGDKVRILDASEIRACAAKDGDILKVISIDSYGDPVLLDVDGDWLTMHKSELRHIELVSASQSKSQRITTLEKANADMLNEIKALTSRITTLEKRPVSITEQEYDELVATKAIIERHRQTPNQRRKAVIERAKAFVADIERKASGITRNHEGNYVFQHNITKPEYFVNKDKRVVTVVVRKKNLDKQILTKAIAKCSPDDVFNVHIGKAIALAKAYGLEVPREFTHAPQPEIAVGQVVRNTYNYSSFGNGIVSHFENASDGQPGYRTTDSGWNFVKDATIIDDSEAQYDE